MGPVPVGAAQLPGDNRGAEESLRGTEGQGREERQGDRDADEETATNIGKDLFPSHSLFHWPLSRRHGSSVQQSH